VHRVDQHGHVGRIHRLRDAVSKVEDMARAVAKAIFGDPNKVQLRVITAGDRIPLLKDPDRPIDMVARNMSMTCGRWNDIGFSAEYYRSGQKVLVSKALPGAKDLSLADLKGKRVCAPAGTTSLTKLQQVPGPVVVTASTHTGCLVLLQQGKADAITGDDTVLAGFAAQDAYAKVVGAAFSLEPYGLGINRKDPQFTRFVNAVLEELRQDGTLESLYTKWMADAVGGARPAIPQPQYRRTVSALGRP
jgi:polar amino acid transport system substrate-binding protein